VPYGEDTIDEGTLFLQTYKKNSKASKSVDDFIKDK
jgi:hypothetical protein